MLDKSSKGRNPTTNAYQPAPRHTTGWLCLAMAILAAASVDAAGFGLVVPPHTDSFLKALFTLASVIIVLAEGVRRYAPGVGATNSSRHLWAAGISTMGCLIEIPIRICLEAPHLMDSFLLTLLRNAMIGTATLSHHPLAQGPAVALSVFVFVFSSACFDASESTLPWCNYLSVIFAILAIFWLGARYWQRLSINTASTVVYRKRPWWTAAIALPLALPLLFPATTGRLIATEGWLPTSGGGTDSSPMARDGIGDGDLLIAGLDNIRSFAPIENAPFAASHDATLYDVFDESYNEAVFTKKKQQKVISLEPEIRALAENHRMAQSQKGSREFSTVRRPGKAKSQPISGINSDALLYVRGRLPLHLKFESFDIYDGERWSAEELSDAVPELTLETIADRPWLRVGIKVEAHDPYAEPEIHSIKVINLKTNRVPTPIQFTGVSIDKLNRSDFFRWGQPGILAVDRDTIPDLTTLHVQSRVVDVRKLPERDQSGIFSPKQYRQFDNGNSSDRVLALAKKWTAGMPKGWPQINAIMTHLRQDYTVDTTSRATGSTGHSVGEFLFETKRGPDYLFATAAVWLLRSLNYPARFITGFYARPDRYDPKSGLTAVRSDDVHCWAEVLVQRHHWVTLEPTPGYELLAPPMNLMERIAHIVWLAYSEATRHLFSLCILSISLLLSILFRARIVDVIDVALLQIHTTWSRHQHTLNTMRTLDRRCQRTGLARPQSVSPRRWLNQLANIIKEQPTRNNQSQTSDLPAVEDFLFNLDRSLYDPAINNGTQQAPTKLCNAALNTWSWNNLMRISRSTSKHHLAYSSFSKPYYQRDQE